MLCSEWLLSSKTKLFLIVKHVFKKRKEIKMLEKGFQKLPTICSHVTSDYQVFQSVSLEGSYGAQSLI